MDQQLVPDPFLILRYKLKQLLHARNSFKIKIFERESESLKKVNFIFLSNPVAFNGQSYQKQKGSRPSDQSLFRLQKKLRKIPLFVIYYQTKFDDVM